MRIKRKGESGAATAYVSRKKALKKLQLSLKDFRRLCILKGVYPHEPNNRKKVNKGSTENRIFYYAKDINFLMQEPIINKFREYKVFLRKLNHAKARREKEKMKRIYERKPEYSLDRIVRERYPTFSSALRELDDALSMCFLYARFTKTKATRAEMIEAATRLTAEFMHYVIEARAITNTFISIKGIYYQAEINGEKVTWIVPHDRGMNHVTRVDFTVLSTFTEFYVAMLSFVNFRLYQQLGLHYPPKIQTAENVLTTTEEDGTSEEYTERVYSLARPLARSVEKEEEVEIDSFEGDEEEVERKLNERKALRNLFSGSVFWINRECPKEALTLLIRGCGGSVGWEGAPVSLQEDSGMITHHVIDRPLKEANLTRTYIQPQWVFDCVNARRRLPTSPYAPGAALPPHLSPFSAERQGDYVPIERIEELRQQGKDVSSFISAENVAAPDTTNNATKKEKRNKDAEKSSKLGVKQGQMHKIHRQKIINMQGEALKMREMMIPRKQQRIYQKLKRGLKRTRTEGSALARKREKLQKQKVQAEQPAN